MEAILDKDTFYPGDICRLQLKIDNSKSKLKVRGLKIYIKRYVSMVLPSYTYNTKHTMQAIRFTVAIGPEVKDLSYEIPIET